MHTENIFSRSELLLGKNYYKRFADKIICVFGLGGVGGYVTEILARSGIVNFILIDGDKIDITNINRQILATQSSIGKEKCIVCKTRLLDINPKCNIEVFSSFILPDSPELAKIFSRKIDYVIDAVDTISLKIDLAKICEKQNIPIISAMGCGNRLQAQYKFSDIYSTSYCPVCRILRKKLKDAGVKKLKVLYSQNETIRQTPVASVPWTPAIAGIMIATEVIRELYTQENSLE